MVTLTTDAASADRGLTFQRNQLRSRAGRLRPTFRMSFTIIYLTLLGAGSLLLSSLPPARHDAILQLSSTDVDHLTARPIFALVSSALWVDGIGDYLMAAVVLGVVGALLERRIGTRWVIAVFASGHVIATLATEGAVAFGVHAGLLPSGALSRIDVGVSYGLAAILAAAAVLLAPRLRLVGVFLAWCYLGFPLAHGLDMTSWGHVIALGIGTTWWPLVQRRGGRQVVAADADEPRVARAGADRQ